MKKQTKGYIIIGILFVLLTFAMFLIPSKRTTTYYVSYGFTALAIVLQIPIWNISIKNNNQIRSKYLGLSIIKIGHIYLVLQICLWFGSILFTSASRWVTILLQVVLICFAAIEIIFMDTAREKIEEVQDKIGEKVKIKTDYIKQISNEIQILAEYEKDENIKEKLKGLEEKIRFSDPMSNERVRTIETEISEKIQQLKMAENKTALIIELNSLIDQRNEQIKTLK